MGVAIRHLHVETLLVTSPRCRSRLFFVASMPATASSSSTPRCLLVYTLLHIQHRLNILQAVNPVRTYLYYPRRHEAGCYKRKQLVLSETPGRTCVALESSKGDITRPGYQFSVCMITVKSESISQLEK